MLELLLIVAVGVTVLLLLFWIAVRGLTWFAIRSSRAHGDERMSAALARERQRQREMDAVRASFPSLCTLARIVHRPGWTLEVADAPGGPWDQLGVADIRVKCVAGPDVELFSAVRVKAIEQASSSIRSARKEAARELLDKRAGRCADRAKQRADDARHAATAAAEAVQMAEYKKLFEHQTVVDVRGLLGEWAADKVYAAPLTARQRSAVAALVYHRGDIESD